MSTIARPVAEPRPLRHSRPNPWRSSDYRTLLLGMGPAMLGVWIQTIALSWLVLDIGGTAFDLGLVQAVSAFPMLLFGLLGGVIADSVDRKKLVVVTRGLMSASYAVLGGLALAGLVNLPIILIISGVGGILMAFDLPARQSMVPQLVEPEEETAAIAWISTVMNAARVAGPAAGGILLGLIGPAYCFLICGVGYAIMAFFTSRIRRSTKPAGARQRDIGRDLLTGLAYVAGNPTVLALIGGIAVSSIFWQSHITLLPIYARDVLNSGASGYGLLSAASGIGALAGAICVALFAADRFMGWVLFASGVIASVLLAIWAGIGSFPLSLFGLVVVTLFGAGYQTLASTLLQKQVPTDLMGRVMSVFFVTWGMTPIGVLLAGWLADRQGAPFSVVVLSILTLVGTLVMFSVAPGLRRL